MEKKRVWGLFFIMSAVIASLYFDKEIISLIGTINLPILTNFFSVLTFLSGEIILLALVISLFLWRENKRKWILPLWLSFFLSGVVSFILKISFQRARPFQLGLISLIPSLIEKSHSIWNFSFPSSHSLLAFSILPILAQQFPKLKKWFFGFATLVGFSRVYFGLHFLSDVIAGAVIGYAIGALIVFHEKDKKTWERFYDKVKYMISYKKMERTQKKEKEKQIKAKLKEMSKSK